MTESEHGNGVDDESTDPLWRVSAYRLSLDLLESAKRDATAMLKYPLSKALADQLYRSAASIGANLAEGYSKSSGKDRVRFLSTLSAPHESAAIGTARH